MLQRVQSIFLLLVAICMILMLFFPIWSKGGTSDDQTEMIELNAFKQVYTSVDTMSADQESAMEEETVSRIYIAILALIAAGVAVFSIFKYGNRLTQIKLGALNSLLMAGTLGLSLYFIMDAEKVVNPSVQGNYSLGFFMPIAALIFNMLANRFIRRDEKLVRSVDRIR